MSQPTSAGQFDTVVSTAGTSQAGEHDKELKTMTKTLSATSPAADAAIETVEAALADLDLGEEIIEEPVEQEISTEEEQALEVGIAKAELYAAAPASTVAADAAKAPKAKKAKGEKKAKTPKVAVSDLPPSAFYTSVALPADGDKAGLLAKRPSQKKIAEKFDNLIQARNAGKAPSVYVVHLFKMLDAKKTVTSQELVTGLMAMTSNREGNYSDGTARSQVGQIMALFDILGIAKREKSSLTLNVDSAFAAWLRAL